MIAGAPAAMDLDAILELDLGDVLEVLTLDEYRAVVGFLQLLDQRRDRDRDLDEMIIPFFVVDLSTILDSIEALDRQAQRKQRASN